MPRATGPGRCVHCLLYTDQVTSDHAFPESWYPDTTPGDLEKWQIPACKECNARYGKLEADLLLRMGLCLDPADLRSLGVTDRVQRSIDPSAARNERDRQHRLKRRQMVLRQLLPVAAVPAVSVFPGFGPQPGNSLGEQVGIGVSPDALIALCEKIVRGVTYVLDGAYIEEDHQIEIFFRYEEDAGIFRDLLNRFGVQHHRGPGISVTRAVANDDPRSGIYEMVIWGRFKAWATVRPSRVLASLS